MNTLSRRIVGAIPVILGISFLIFLLMHIAPGDPVSLLLGDDATPADIERTRHEWGLDRPLHGAVLGFSHSGGHRRLRQIAQVQRTGHETGRRAAAGDSRAGICQLVRRDHDRGAAGRLFGDQAQLAARSRRHERRADRRVAAQFLARHHVDLFSRRPAESVAGRRPHRVRHRNQSDHRSLSAR